MVYMVWNAVNDPLVGWLSDIAPGLTKRRIPAIKYGGPLWAVIFALAWYDLDYGGVYGSILAGVHFTIILCLYDALLTIVEVNHGALLADMCNTVEDRTRLNTATAIGAIIGSVSSFFAHLYWTPGKDVALGQFQRFRWPFFKTSARIAQWL
jgi:Na+/melibiose symporter-like transporter